MTLLADPRARTTSEQVVSWRVQRLLRAGFPSVLALGLAADCRFDLHALLDLVERGCPPALAARILDPLPDGRRPC
jgi:hypothetical protein